MVLARVDSASDCRKGNLVVMSIQSGLRFVACGNMEDRLSSQRSQNKGGCCGAASAFSGVAALVA